MKVYLEFSMLAALQLYKKQISLWSICDDFAYWTEATCGGTWSQEAVDTQSS